MQQLMDFPEKRLLGYRGTALAPANVCIFAEVSGKEEKTKLEDGTKQKQTCIVNAHCHRSRESFC